MRYKSFLINLDKSTKRLESSKKKLDQLGIEFDRVSAIHGTDLSKEDINKVYTSQGLYNHHKELNRGEIGCYLSHRNVWQEIVSNNLDFALIFEDDFDIDINSIDPVLEKIISIGLPWHYIKLAGRFKPSDSIYTRKGDPFDLCLLRKVPTRTCAQAVSFEGAQRLLMSTRTFGRPIDVDLQYWWEKNIWVHGLLPYPFSANDQSESEIEKFSKRKTAKKKPLKRLFNKSRLIINSRVQSKRLLHKVPQLGKE